MIKNQPETNPTDFSPTGEDLSENEALRCVALGIGQHLAETKNNINQLDALISYSQTKIYEDDRRIKWRPGVVFDIDSKHRANHHVGFHVVVVPEATYVFSDYVFQPRFGDNKNARHATIDELDKLVRVKGILSACGRVPSKQQIEIDMNNNQPRWIEKSENPVVMMIDDSLKLLPIDPEKMAAPITQIGPIEEDDVFNGIKSVSKLVEVFHGRIGKQVINEAVRELATEGLICHTNPTTGVRRNSYQLNANQQRLVIERALEITERRAKNKTPKKPTASNDAVLEIEH
ncbi:MAG: hypothetical protein LBU20_02300 [Candidatus Nomurabacteria bacterium]|jgi:hypothetical protein|nr:hypothetical protein [Candidatus Nomurabacteria bacterium]